MLAAIRTMRSPGRALRLLFAGVVSAFPVLALALVVLVFYAVEAWSRKTPSIFSDELEWTQISRSIAATGHAARRTEPIYFKSLYAYAIAPFWWWFTGTPAAYSAIKYANAVMMSLAAVPTYLLARMLVSKRSAVVVAIASISVPAMAYVTSIVPEVVGYPYYALCSWLAVRALASGKRLDMLYAVVFTVGGYFIRQKEFSSLPIALALAAAGLWLTGQRGRAWRRQWTRGDTIGAVVLAVGAFYLFNRVVLQHVQEWQVVSQYYKNRMVDLGLRAGLSLTIGLGLLPVIGGLTALRLPERRGDPTYRAFVAWSSASIFALSIYTADKAAYLSTVFATLWEERNMIYLAPLLLLGTALVYESKRVDRRVLGAASAFVLLLIAFVPIQDSFGYYEAPGSTIPAILNYYEHWSIHRERWALAGLLGLVLVLIAARRRRAVAALTAALLLAWMLSGEIAMTVGIDHGADKAGAYVASPANWVDQATGGQPVTILGQSITDPNGVEETEFWNRTIDHVNDLDGSAPGPGPHATTGLLGTTGILAGYASYPYVLAYNGVAINAPIVAKQGCDSTGTSCLWTLYRKHGPWRLTGNTQYVYNDGWCGYRCAYTYYVPHQSGTLEIILGRTAYKGNAPPGKVTLRIGTVALDSNQAPRLGHVFKTVHTLIHNNAQADVNVVVARTPVRVEITIPNPIPPQGTEIRSLGAQVVFRFHPAAPK